MITYLSATCKRSKLSNQQPFFGTTGQRVRTTTTRTWVMIPIFYKMVQHQPLFRLFLVFSIKIIQFLKPCEKCSTSIQYGDSNSQPLDYESPPLITRPGLPSILILWFVPPGIRTRARGYFWIGFAQEHWREPLPAWQHPLHFDVQVACEIVVSLFLCQSHNFLFSFLSFQFCFIWILFVSFNYVLS